MFGNLTGWHFAIILAIVLLLFGAPRLPALAKSIGQSMRIFKSEVKNKDGDDVPASNAADVAVPQRAESADSSDTVSKP